MRKNRSSPPRSRTGIGLVLMGAAALAIAWTDYLVFSEPGNTMGGGNGLLGLDGSSAYRITYAVAGILLVAVGVGKLWAGRRTPRKPTDTDDH